jgi:hypothetical protein
VRLAELFPEDIYRYAQEWVPKPLYALEISWAAFDLALSHDESLIAVSLWEEIALIRAASGELISQWRVPPGNEPQRTSSVGRLTFSSNNGLLASVGISSYAGAGGIWLWPISELL